MKRRYIVIPVTALVLALLIGVFVTVFTTPLSAYLCESNDYTEYVKDDGTVVIETNDYFYTSKKVGKIMQTAYKLNPSQENLDALVMMYSAKLYIDGKHRGNTPPADYLKNCVKYQKIFYESEYNEEEGMFAVGCGDMVALLHNVGKGVDYAKALYLDGQIDESKKIMEEVLGMITPDDNVALTLIKDYYYLVYSTTESVTLKQWVLEKEAQLEKFFKGNEKVASFIEKHGFMFSNPDFETYIDIAGWPDFQQVEGEIKAEPELDN